MKLLLNIAILFVFFSAMAQMPQKRPQLLTGHEIKITPLSKMMLEAYSGYKGFYTDEALTTIYKKGSKETTTPDALEGKIFKVVSVTPFSYLGNDYFKLKLQGNGETLYYKHQKDYNVNFEVLNLKLPDDYYCDYIVKGKFDATIDSYTVERRFVYRLGKYIDGTALVYNLHLETSKDGEGSGGLGVTLNLENGKKIVKPNARVDKSKAATPQYSSSFYLTEDEIDLLKANKIVGYTLFKTEAVLFGDDAEIIKGVIPCLKTIK